jgi:serine/threonine protein kinase
MSSKMLGRIIKDRYKLIDELGRGTFASVYITRDVVDNHLYAIKIMHLHHLENKAAIMRFQREAAILQQLSDPHIVHIFDYGDDHDVYYIVMDYVDGKTLRDYMHPHIPLELPVVLDYVQQIAEGLDTTYKKSVVHRDIKPQNILINRKGVVKIADFGLALSDTPTLTNSDDFMGTAYYVSPEQVDNAHNADIRSDLYSLTVILFEMLSGRPPFTGTSLMLVVSEHKTTPVPSLCQIRPELPTDFDLFIRKGMAKAPGERFQKPSEFLAALAHLPRVLPPARMAYLVFPALEQTVSLAGEQMMVGRPAHNRPKPDICLDNDKVGRRQACIRNKHGIFSIEDLKSTNPTRLNGMLLPPNQEHLLQEGDTILFGPIEARFEFH